jgi:hypothetical protein
MIQSKIRLIFFKVLEYMALMKINLIGAGSKGIKAILKI